MKKIDQFLRCVSLVTVFGTAGTAHADVITNGLASSQLGYLAIDVTAGGETRDGRVTATNASTSTLVQNQDIIFDYFTYVSYGGTTARLTGSITSSNGNTVVSSGSLGGGAVLWTATSVLPVNGTKMTTTFDFSAAIGSTLSGLRLWQYLDEDVLGTSNVFLVRGTAAAGTLELFTVDGTALFGVSHGGAYSAAQGLVNASFSGWALCNFDGMSGAITAGTQQVAATGSRAAGCNTSTTNIPALGGTVDGVYDIVSVLAWDAAQGATSSRIITTLGGVPDVNSIPTDTDVPEPASLALLGLGFAGIGFARRRKA